jgi:Predicted acetyltransferases and hydrolases with the alpha/beta hydrolase fold
MGMTKIALATTLAALILASCATPGSGRGSKPRSGCATRYPIILVHGMGGHVSGPRSYPYWGSIVDSLREHGAKVYLSSVDGFSSIENCALQLERDIRDVIASSGAPKVNIVAHSMGGLEARYYISSLGHGDIVASLTTINTPHRGTSIAELFVDDHPIASSHLGELVDAFYSGWFGEKDANAFLAARELTRSYCADFNLRNADDPRVYYQSYTSVIGARYDAAPLVDLYEMLYKSEGPNDGLVSVSSARWGVFRGVIGADRGLMISHNDVHGLPISPDGMLFDASAFFVGVAEDLRDDGF